jgi:hypothetical protein
MKKVLLFTFLLFLFSCISEVVVSGIIKEKSTVYSCSTGDIEYHTLVLLDDGTIEDVVGSWAYINPIGSRITFKKIK